MTCFVSTGECGVSVEVERMASKVSYTFKTNERVGNVFFIHIQIQWLHNKYGKCSFLCQTYCIYGVFGHFSQVQHMGTRGTYSGSALSEGLRGEVRLQNTSLHFVVYFKWLTTITVNV